ncbi:MAG: tyrosine--tRNA ligase [Acidobacteria bacterium]|nr:MAG: tyrosine--tRNA ligase [Acidobacteriota bacterium]
MAAPDVYTEFEWRGMVYESTEGLRDTLRQEHLTCYIGFDPTASSLHVGSLLPMMALARLQRFGHRPIAIVGGGTGLIGDPSGKSSERSLLDRDKVKENLAGIRKQLEKVLDFDAPGNPALVVDNADWLCQIDLMGFLRDIGKHFTVNYMLAKESVKRRLEQEDGISFTEFSYLLLQAYDFLTLFDRHGCTLQLGGSDQWGNITAGADLIRRLRGAKAHGLVLPLVTTTTGVKFGKTEAGTVWLDPARTSPYAFYQFWFNTDDRDVVSYLKYFTFLDEATIVGLEASLRSEPEKRVAQRELAREVTRLIHGDEALARAEEASSRLFAGGPGGRQGAGEVLEVLGDVPASEIPASRFEPPGVAIVELLTTTGLASSRSEAARLIRGGGVYLNGERLTDERARVTSDRAIDGQVLVLQKGQRNKHVVKLTEG